MADSKGDKAGDNAEEQSVEDTVSERAIGFGHREGWHTFRSDPYGIPH